MARPRLQFGLTTLFLFVTLCAVATHWISTTRRLNSAKSRYREAWPEGLNYGTATKRDIYELSKALLNAELAVPFADKESAYLDHVERLESLEWRLRSFYLVGVRGNTEDDYLLVQEADEAGVWRQEAERLLDENCPMPD